MQEYVRAERAQGRRDLRGPRRRRQGRRDQAHHRAHEPAVCRVVALPAPTERERTQWYFQRYVAHLPAGGEIVLFDRSWYNRAGVERVMGFCTERGVRGVPALLPGVRAHAGPLGDHPRQVLVLGLATRSRSAASRPASHDPMRRWKLCPMDLESRARWVEYSRAKDEMFRYTDIKQAPWYVVEADDKRRARLNCIAHLLSLIHYEDLTPPPLELPAARGRAPTCARRWTSRPSCPRSTRHLAIGPRVLGTVPVTTPGRATPCAPTARPRRPACPEPAAGRA